MKRARAPNPEAPGPTGVPLSPIGMGDVPLGEVYETLTENQAQATLQASWAAGIRYFDTFPW
jgi:D-threo-aldose 1-dehydrogenase